MTTPYRLLEACECESPESIPRSSTDVVDPCPFFNADLGLGVLHHNFVMMFPDFRELPLTLLAPDGPTFVFGGDDLPDFIDDDEPRLDTSLFSSSSGYDDTRDFGGAVAGNGGRLLDDDCFVGF